MDVTAVTEVIHTIVDAAGTAVQSVIDAAAPVLSEIVALAQTNPIVAVGLIAVVAWIILTAVA